MQNTSQIGLIGLAVMGANLALNIANHSYKISVYNRTYDRTKEFLDRNKHENLSGYQSLSDFVSSIALPRKIILMVKAGDAVDQMIEQLLPLLTPGDILIDAGNSWYQDTKKRVAFLHNHQIKFVGMGVSGGEEGALKGPSLMPGGEISLWSDMEPILKVIAAKDFNQQPCVTWVGQDGSGHFVKMVHNGIEYAIMQLLSEAYWLLKKSGKSNEQIAQIFETWDQGLLNSFLTNIIPHILRQKDQFSGNDLIEMILDSAAQKGTGAWTTKEALDRGVSTSAISEAVFARSLSAKKKLRENLADLTKSVYTERNLEQMSIDPLDLEQALFACILLAYAQGFDLIQTTAHQEKWQINLSEIARIWQGGCIIRAQLLTIIQEIFLKNGNLENLLLSSKIIDLITPGLNTLSKILNVALTIRQPLPVFFASYNYFQQISSPELPANLLQAMRDYFGAHTYQRRDKSGDFHTEWLIN